MANLKTTSPICTSIGFAFLHFLSSVEGMTNTEIEYLKDLEHALKEIFNISDSDMESKKPKESLPSMFNARKTKPQNQTISDSHVQSTNADMPAPSSRGPAIKIDLSSAQLFHEFCLRLTECRFFDFIFGEDYSAQRTRAKNIFKEALELLMEVGTQTFNLEILAHALQTLGLKAFNLKCYYKSVELYSCAIALFRDIVEYFCDRAWALMMIERYQEAMNDCYRATKLKPKYLRAYMGVGCVYLEQGKSIEAICHGFIKVLQIDPYNKDVVEKLEVAEDKLKQQRKRIDEQLQFLKGCDFIPRSAYQPKEDQQGMVVEFGVAPAEEGGGASKPASEVVEDEGDENYGDTISDFVDLFACYSVPLK